MLTIDPSGASRSTEWDGHSRPSAVTARNGARTEYAYDAAGYLLGTTVRGSIPGHLGVKTLAESRFHYDALGRSYRRDRALFDHDPATTVLDDGALMPNDGWVSSIAIHDALGRVIGVLDSDADLMVWEYDGVHELRRRIDAVGNEVLLQRDFGRPGSWANRPSNIPPIPSVFLANPGIWSLSETPWGGSWRKSMPLGNRQEYAWDRFSRLRNVRDAKDNLTEWERDSLGRIITERRWISASGYAADESTADLTQAGGDGVVTLGTVYDDLHRVTARIDDHGNQTSYQHDALSRTIRETRADNSFASWSWSAAGFLDTWRATNGSVTSFSRDASGHLEAEAIVRGPGIVGSTSRTYALDSLGRRWGHTDDNGDPSLGVTVSFQLDSLHRRFAESSQVGNGTSSSSRWTWSGSRRRVRDVHPTGASFSRTFDGLDRVTRVTRDSDGLALARYGYVGPRLLAADYGNGTGIDMANDAGSGTLTGAGAGYDALGRAVDWTWDHASTSNPIAGWTQSFDPTHRRTSVTESHLGNRVVSMAYDFSWPHDLLCAVWSGAVQLRVRWRGQNDRSRGRRH